MSLNSEDAIGRGISSAWHPGVVSKFCMSFSSDFDELVGVRRFLRERCKAFFEEANCPEEFWKLELATVEAIVNAVKHSYNARPDCKLRLELEIQVDRVQVDICHWGTKFRPDSIPQPKLDGKSDSGFGLYLINRCTDSVEYVTDDTGMTRIRLIKRV